jgi:hypothetical protein
MVFKEEDKESVGINRLTYLLCFLKKEEERKRERRRRERDSSLPLYKGL